MLIIFFPLFIIFYCFQTYRRGPFNSIFVILGPYVILTVFNNVFMVKAGYFKVNDNVIFTLIIALIVVFAVSESRSKVRLVTNRSDKANINEFLDTLFFDQKKMNVIKTIFFFACSVRLIQIVGLIRRYGMAFISQSDFSDLGLKGFSAHLFLMAFPLAPILFMDFVKRKSKAALLLYMYGLAVAFASFIKYHAIFYVVLTFVFCIIAERKLAKKLSVLLIAMVVFLFVGSYAVSFIIRNMRQYSVVDILYRMWDYLGGSMINGNYCINFFHTYIDFTSLDLLEETFMPIPYEIYNAFSNNEKLLPAFPLGFKQIRRAGDTSNVAGTLFNVSYTGSVLLFIAYLAITAFIVEGILQKIRDGENQENLIFQCMFVTIIFMSFFANYFGLSTIWELLIWSFIIPKILFNNHVQIKIRRN